VVIDIEPIRERFSAVAPFLDERGRAKLAHCRRLLAVPKPVPPAPAADYRERYQQLTGRSLDLCLWCGGRMIEIGVIPRASTSAAAASWKPHDPYARPHQSPVSRTGVSCRRRHSAIAFRYRRQTVSRQSTLQAAATSGAIDQSTSQGRHQHPNRGSLARRLDPAAPLRPDHRQRPIPIARAPDPRLRSTRLLCNPALLQCSIDRAHDAGSRRTLNHSGEGDHPLNEPACARRE
jgi:hypothetical protein